MHPHLALYDPSDDDDDDDDWLVEDEDREEAATLLRMLARWVLAVARLVSSLASRSLSCCRWYRAWISRYVDK